MEIVEKKFQALTTILGKDGVFRNEVRQKLIGDLPDGDLTIRVEYSSLNYKDALSATGVKGITRNYPHTPGIDAAGVIEDSSDDGFPVGTTVIVTGYDLGMNTSGGFGEYIRVPSKWVVKCPEALTTREAMMIGTAGLTAGFSVEAINEKFAIDGLKVVVSGATGGVGSLAVKILNLLGCKVTAITGKSNVDNYLSDLGASEIIQRDEFLNRTRQPLNKRLFDAAVDVVGGSMLSCIIASMHYNGVVTCCGNVGSPKLETTVFPFILRGNSLIGIDSAEKSIGLKEKIWNHFATDWKLQGMNFICREVKLDGLMMEIEKILQGHLQGRVLVKL